MASHLYEKHLTLLRSRQISRCYSSQSVSRPGFIGRHRKSISTSNLLSRPWQDRLKEEQSEADGNSSGGFPLFRDDMAVPNMDYLKQGRAEYYTRRALEERKRLSRHPKVKGAITAFWNTFNDINTWGTIPKTSYIALHKR